MWAIRYLSCLIYVITLRCWMTDALWMLPMVVDVTCTPSGPGWRPQPVSDGSVRVQQLHPLVYPGDGEDCSRHIQEDEG